MKRARTDCRDVRTITKRQYKFARSVYSVLQYADFIPRCSLLSKCCMVPQSKYNLISIHKNGPPCADIYENHKFEAQRQYGLFPSHVARYNILCIKGRFRPQPSAYFFQNNCHFMMIIYIVIKAGLHNV